MGLFSGGLGGLGKVAAIINPAMAIGAVTTAGDSILQSYANRKAAQKANKYAYTAWQLQNEYNTPLEQRQRLEEAGYNPNLWYTNGNTGNAGTLATTGYQAADWQLGKNALNGLAQYQQMQATQANIRNTDANTELAKYNASNADIQGQILRHNLGIAQELHLPVGQIETYPTRVLDELIGGRGDKGSTDDTGKKKGWFRRLYDNITTPGSLSYDIFSRLGGWAYIMDQMEQRQRSRKW